MSAISEERRKAWQTLIESTYMAHNSKKAWSTIRKLCDDPCKPKQHCNTTANQAAHQLLLNGRVPNRQPKVRLDRQRYPDGRGFTIPFTAAELDIGIRVLKKGIAPGLDDIQTELIKHFGPKARDWLLRFFNNSTVDPSVAKSFRPISLLCHTYKLFERLTLNRIAEHVDAKLTPKQVGFRPVNRVPTSQLLNLTELIADGYEKRLITCAVFVDLYAAYDTVNHRRLLGKVVEMTGDVHLTYLIRTMLESRRFFVVLNGKNEPLVTTTKRNTTGKCTGTDVAQHIHQRPAHTPRHSQLHLRRRLVHRVARKILQQHQSATHVCPEQYL